MYKCPKCGIVEGYAITVNVKRTILYGENDEPYDEIDDLILYGKKIKRCIDCGSKVKKIGGIKNE